MVMTFVTVLSLSCAPAKLLNRSKEKWNKVDKAHKTYAMKQCKKVFPDNPCLVKFIKQKPLTYRVICGKRK